VRGIRNHTDMRDECRLAAMNRELGITTSLIPALPETGDGVLHCGACPSCRSHFSCPAALTRATVGRFLLTASGPR
jgi:hypothetical protein